MKKIYILFFISCICILTACIGTSNNQSSSISSAQNQIKDDKLTALKDSNIIPFNDFTSTSGQCLVTQCSKDNSICASLNSCISAQYAAGNGGSNYWISQEQNIAGGIFKLNFNKANISKSFHLSDIYNELHYNGSVGQIEQIDMRACDALIAKGNKAGDSCNIDFVYYGQSFTQSSVTNNVHLVFSSINEDEKLNFSFPIANNYTTNQNVPILDVLGSQMVNFNINNLSEISLGNNQYDLYYSSEFSQSLINNGVDPLLPVSGSADVNVALGAKMGMESNPLYYLYNSTITSCGNNPVGSWGICMFGYSNPDLIASSSSTSELRRFGYIYSNNQQQKNVNNTKFFVVGIGDIQSKDYPLFAGDDESKSYQILLKKISYGNQALAYDIPLKNLKLRAVYNPMFPMAVNQFGDNLYYSYGDIDNLSLSNIVANIDLDYDSNCFNSGFDINIESPNMAYKECPVNINIKTHSYKPIGFLLYASYDSPIGKQINQLIGSVSLVMGTSKLPTGNYTDVFKNIKYDNNLLLTGTSNYSGEEHQLDYFRNCAGNSDVSYFETSYKYQFEARIIGTKRDDFLTCTKLSPQLPHGAYYQTCANINYSNNILTADCKYEYKNSYGPATGVKNSKLDYSKCLDGDQVMNVYGDLSCVTNPL